MNRQELDGLIGLSVNDASLLIFKSKMAPRSYLDGTVTPSYTIPPNVVQIYHDKNDIVISAETQASIDASYC